VQVSPSDAGDDEMTFSGLREEARVKKYEAKNTVIFFLTSNGT
jgi:hypothetical protein